MSVTCFFQIYGCTLSINRRTHSSPPASGDSDDRMDMALLNFENDPADVRAADPPPATGKLAVEHASIALCVVDEVVALLRDTYCCC